MIPPLLTICSTPQQTRQNEKDSLKIESFENYCWAGYLSICRIPVGFSPFPPQPCLSCNMYKEYPQIGTCAGFPNLRVYPLWGLGVSMLGTLLCIRIGLQNASRNGSNFWVVMWSCPMNCLLSRPILIFSLLYILGTLTAYLDLCLRPCWDIASKGRWDWARCCDALTRCKAASCVYKQFRN